MRIKTKMLTILHSRTSTNKDNADIYLLILFLKYDKAVKAQKKNY